MKKLITLFFITFTLFGPIYAGDMQIEVIPLQHRMSDDVVSILRPLLAPGGTITGMNNQLIVKTTPENLEEIKSVLASIDSLPRRLMISVRQDVDGSFKSRDQAVSGRYKSGDVIISNESRNTGAGVEIGVEDKSGNNLKYHLGDSSGNSSANSDFRVQATEGYPAYINTGTSVPVQSSNAYVTRNGVVVNDSVDYIEAESGFYVLPRLNGDQVTLLVAPKLTRVAPGRSPVFDTQNVQTTATGYLGEWIELGGINQQTTSDGSANLSNSKSFNNELRSVLIRVDEIK